MVDAFEVANLLVAHATRHHATEIDLIGYYGSRARGDARPNSDLDLFYVPAESSDPPLARTFLLNGVLFDFWKIPWDRLEAFATGRARGWSFAPGIVRDAIVLHARSPESGTRLERLKQLVAELQTPAAFPGMLQRALDAHERVLPYLTTLRAAAKSGALGEARSSGWSVLSGVWEALALVNQTFFTRGLPGSLAEVERLPLRPAALSQLARTIATSSDVALVLEASERLVRDTGDVLHRAEQRGAAR
jgi:predicted nucleotidyltransferase